MIKLLKWVYSVNISDLARDDEGNDSSNCSENVKFADPKKVNLVDSNINDETSNDHDETTNGVQIVRFEDKVTHVQSESATSEDKIASIGSKAQIEPQGGSVNSIRSTGRMLKTSTSRLHLRDIQVERQRMPNRKYQPYHADVKLNRTHNSTNFIPPLLQPNNFTID